MRLRLLLGPVLLLLLVVMLLLLLLLLRLLKSGRHGLSTGLLLLHVLDLRVGRRRVRVLELGRGWCRRGFRRHALRTLRVVEGRVWHVGEAVLRRWGLRRVVRWYQVRARATHLSSRIGP